MVDDVSEASIRRPVAGATAGVRRVAIDARIASIARRQRGLITRRQLLADVGLGPDAVDRRITIGQLVCVHRGVYRVAGPPVPLSWAMAAALVGGYGAVVSGRSAAALHGIGPRGRRVEITAPGEHRQPAIQSRRMRLPRNDVTVHLDGPVTTVARTVFDIAGKQGVSAAGLAALVNRGRLIRPGLLAELDLLISRERRPGVSGLAERRLQHHLADANGPVRSVFEGEFRLTLARSDLPPAQFNVHVAGIEVDTLWPDAALVVELDGIAFHGDPGAFERDRERDSCLIALG